jgi:replicative DNA helicase
MESFASLMPPEPPPESTAFVDQEAEQAVLAAVLLGGTSVADHVLTAGLRPHHFWTSRYGDVFTAIMGLSERQRDIDPVIVRAELERMMGDRSAAKVEIELLSYPTFSTHAVTYAERVIELHTLRSTQHVLYEASDAVRRLDKEGMARAVEKLIRAPQERRRDSLSAVDWAEIISDYLSAEPESGFVPLPFPSLTAAMGGGILPGELMLISGYTNHGKSIIADQLLDQAAKHGRTCHLYMTEMTAAQRGLRYVSRHTGIPFGRLRARKIDQDQWEPILRELNRLPYGCSVVSDWDIEDVVRDALRARYDLVVIDLIHGFRYDDERGLDRLSKAAQRLARVSTTRGGYDGTAVVIVAHLSGAQMAGQKSAKRPSPGLHSLKGSTSLSQDPDFVLFVWQQDDEDGLPTGEGKVYIPKARSGENQAVPVRLNPRHLRFEVAADV